MRIVLFAVFLLLNMFSASSVQATTNSHSIDLERDDVQYLYISDEDQINLDLFNDFTIEAWLKFENLPNAGDQMLIVGKDDSPNMSQRQYNFKLNASGSSVYSLELIQGHSGSVTSVHVDWTPELNKWHHVAVTRDEISGAVNFYVDGYKIGVEQISVIGILQDTSSPFAIGANFSNGNQDLLSLFDGLIDEVRVWNDVRAGEEILSNYEIELTGAEDNLVGYWKLNNTLEDVLGINNLNSSGSTVFSTDVPFRGIEENEYPLYTQIESPNPSEEATAVWAEANYASGTNSWCGDTIGECGCVITSLVMSGRNAGIETDVLGGDVNPLNINSYLEEVGGYTSWGALNWLAGSAYLGKINSSGKLASRFASAPKRPSASVGTTTLINNSLTEGDNAVLAYKNGHYIWLPEKTEDSYVVRDPWWYETETANDVDPAGENFVRDYNNVFDDARVIKISDEPVELSGSDIELHLLGTAELLYRNAAGDKVGYVDGSVLIDLENASYGNTEIIGLSGVPDGATPGKHLLVYEAGEKFTVEVVGTEVGEFTLEFFTIDEEGNITNLNFNGVTFPGVTTIFTFDLATGEVAESEITYELFLDMLETVLVDLTNQQKKFFLKWTDKIFKNMEEKTVSQALQSIEVFKKLLVAKKVSSPELITVLEKLENALEQ